MGIYINPVSGTKLEWLRANAIQVPSITALADRDRLPLCHIDNGFFDALAVLFNEGEVSAFTNPSDTRPHTYWFAPRSAVVAPESGLTADERETLT